MKRALLGVGAASALSLVAAALSYTAAGTAAPSAVQPRTTAPPQVITIKIMISDTAIRMTPRSAPRGDMGRFILVNTGTKRHTFALGDERRQTGTQTGFTKSLGPGEQAILLLYLDYRGKLPYLGTLPADRVKPAMKGTFRIF
ncbi:MAG TPA: hypothetical protein VH210_10610 [Gaiellaceae bacterium]|nr:hypothetical protein [Gaiellaceae bacterium]